MRVAFVAPRLDVGGFERQWAHLVPALAARDVAVELFTLDGRGRFFGEIEAAGVPSRCLGLHGRLNVRGAMHAGRTVAMSTPDIVFSAGVSAHTVAYFASRSASAANVVAIHSALGLSDTFTPRRKLIMRFLAHSIDAYTLVTAAQADLLRSLGATEDRTVVVPNGVPVPSVGRSRAAVREEIGVEGGTFVALMVATLRPEKRVDRFVDAVLAARRRDPRIRGVVVGGGPELDSTRALCAATSHGVIALGPRADTGDLMSAADVVCLTSDAEALPLAVLEAMACGLPVVATDVGGVSDAVADGESGVLVPVGDGGVQAFAAALAALAADPGLASAMGSAGRRRHEATFSLERMVDAHLRLFRRVIDGAPGLSRERARQEAAG